MKFSSLSRTQAETLLAALILARSTSYVMTKVGIRGMDTFALLGVRFITAFLILLPLGLGRLRAASRGTALRGMAIGAAFFSVMTLEVTALRTADASTVAFLENMAIVFVPLLEAALHRVLPRPAVVMSALISLSGVALLTLRGGGLALSSGEMLALLAAALYACAIIITDRLSHQDDPLAVGILQVGFMGAFAAAAGVLRGTFRMPASTLEWQVILGLAVICSVFGFTLQPLAQSRTSSERAGLLCALGPAGATLWGRIFLGERVGAFQVLGMALILLGMLFTGIWDRFFGSGGRPLRQS